MKLKPKKIKKIEAKVEGEGKVSGKAMVGLLSTEEAEGTGEATVGIKLGVTMSGPQEYSSIRVDVYAEIPVELTGDDPLGSAFAALKGWAEEKLSNAAEELYKGLEEGDG